MIFFDEGRMRGYVSVLWACGSNNYDAVLWKREELDGLNHNILWFEGKNWSENRPVFARFFSCFKEKAKI